jgi:hypothetical protein
MQPNHLHRSGVRGNDVSSRQTSSSPEHPVMSQAPSLTRRLRSEGMHSNLHPRAAWSPNFFLCSSGQFLISKSTSCTYRHFMQTPGSRYPRSLPPRPCLPLVETKSSQPDSRSAMTLTFIGSIVGDVYVLILLEEYVYQAGHLVPQEAAKTNMMRARVNPTGL